MSGHEEDRNTANVVVKNWSICVFLAAGKRNTPGYVENRLFPHEVRDTPA